MDVHWKRDTIGKPCSPKVKCVMKYYLSWLLKPVTYWAKSKLVTILVELNSVQLVLTGGFR